MPCKIVWVTSEGIRIKRPTNLADPSAQVSEAVVIAQSYPEGSGKWERSNRPMWLAASNEIRMSEAPSSSELTLSLVLPQPCPLRSSSFLRTKRCVQESPWSCLVKWPAPSPSPAPGWSSESRSVTEGSGPRTTHTSSRAVLDRKGWEMLWWRAASLLITGAWEMGEPLTPLSPTHQIWALNNLFFYI